MISLFRRRENNDESVDAANGTADAETEAPTDDAEPKGHTPGKGRPTPKRANKGGAPVAPPATNKEARQRMRDKTRAEREAQQEGIRRGDDKFLFPRDRGPIRAMIRNLVDSRHNVGTWFFAGTLVVVVGSLGVMPPTVRVASTYAWMALIVIFLLDAIYLGFRIRQLVKQRFGDDPKAQGFRMVGHTFYGVMRSVVFRKLRNPAPTAKIGDQV